MGNNVMKQPWREVDFSTSNIEKLKKKLINYNSPNKGIPANILLLGRAGHGKSSFINACETAISDRITSRAVTASSGDACTTQNFIKYQLTSHGQELKQINVNIMDTIGWNPQTFTFEMFDKILDGIEDKESFPIQKTTKSEPRNKVHCVAYVADINQFQHVEPIDIAMLKTFGKHARQKRNINTFIIMTKVDSYISVKEISDIYKRKNIQQLMMKICSLLECDQKFIFPMINYRDCVKVNNDINILALSIMNALVDTASDFIYNN